MDENDILTYALKSGMIDRTAIEQEINMKNKEKYLEMHDGKVWKGKNGKWYTVFYEDGKRRLVKRNTETALQDYIADYYKSREESPTLKQAFEKWIASKLEFNEICKGTFDRYVNDYKRFISGCSIENKFIKNITEDELDTLIRKLIAEKNLSRKAYSNLRTILMGIFKYAKRKKYTDISISTFFKDLELSKRAFLQVYKDPKTQVFSEDEIPIIIDYLEHHPTVGNLAIVLDFQTGLRTAELATLKFSDLNGDILHIQRQEIKYKGEHAGILIHEVVDYTKTENGNRMVLLPQQALNTIKKIRLMNPFGEYMMMENGERLLTNTFNDRLKAACNACGIPPRSMHKIRKTYGTTLIDSGADDSLIMSQMGHSDISTTRQYYYFANKNLDSKRTQIQRAISY